MNDLLLLHNIPKDCIHLVVKDVVLQAVQVLHSDLDVIVDKTLHVGGPDTLFSHHHGLQAAKQGREHPESAGGLGTIAHHTGHMDHAGAQHVIDLLGTQAVEEGNTSGGGRCAGGGAGAGGGHVDIFLGEILQICID